MPIRVLNRAISQAISWSLCAIFPDNGPIPGLTRQSTCDRVEQVLQEAPALLILGLVGSWVAFVLAPVVTIGWPVPALLLSNAALDRHASKMASHPWYWLRQPMLMLKTVGGAIWGERPEVRIALGLQPFDSDPGTWRGDFEVQADSSMNNSGPS
ncbi:MAG TPA: hypothetical protein DCQ06_04440 [Myxococcales bacterium]|nr:hypothetical protein [Myxococcales bacterium]HAN30825.1 hypothetical protein [Myxococcales bacterium]